MSTSVKTTIKKKTATEIAIIIQNCVYMIILLYFYSEYALGLLTKQDYETFFHTCNNRVFSSICPLVPHLIRDSSQPYSWNTLVYMIVHTVRIQQWYYITIPMVRYHFLNKRYQENSMKGIPYAAYIPKCVSTLHSHIPTPCKFPVFYQQCYHLFVRLYDIKPE